MFRSKRMWKMNVASLYLSIIASGVMTGNVVANQTPLGHPGGSLLSKFSPHFRCPYANEWVQKGPQQAALDLGLLWNASSTFQATTTRQAHRRAQDSSGLSVSGSCVYTNAWTGNAACLEMRGDTWTLESMQARCGSETDSSFSAGSPCNAPSSLAGFCVVGAISDGAVEATPMALENGLDCAQVKNACETFIAGTFEAAEGCQDGGEEETGGSSNNFPAAVPSSDGPVTCEIAPGAIGAGHQAAYSNGYSPVCEGTPAEGSPFMWPMAWSAMVEAKSMPFGSDEVVYRSSGKVHYRLDKNWKRQDWFSTRGVQRSIGQSPCEPENVVNEQESDGLILACRRDSDEYRTMIHRGNKMIFITWKNDTQVGSSDPDQIEECEWLDLQVIGNIRPDWFMDDRGDSTDTQYLGNQHVFHDKLPRLVKQWRKKDFASQYFVMSMLANPKEDGIHWPMMLNVPGEGFGDDFLQIYTNHTLLTDEDDNRFLIDEALEKMGKTCQKLENTDVGPPAAGETVKIPSNLEVDPNSWFSNVYTYSPVWQPPAKDDFSSLDAEEEGRAITETDSVVVSSCYDSPGKAVELSVEFVDVMKSNAAELPWMALGYRETEECSMNPLGGGDSKIILLASPSEDESVGAFLGSLPSTARNLEEGAFTSILASLSPLSNEKNYSDVRLELPANVALSKTASSTESESSSVFLHFKESMTEAPEVMHLMYAIGSSPQIGYHLTRSCIEITLFPSCPKSDNTTESAAEQITPGTPSASLETSSAYSAFTVLSVVMPMLAATCAVTARMM